ncbi:MAG TPA: S24 family peptidase [Candidatus Competibacter sp.]|nr:S24 family peptidase [Candidatus Competibacter sp.]
MLAVTAELTAARASRPPSDPDHRPVHTAEPPPGTGWPLPATPVLAIFASPDDDGVECPPSLNEYLIRNPESTFLARASGNSLRDAGICDGDLLVIDRAIPPTSGSIVVAIIEGEFVLQRLDRDDRGRLVMQSTHPDLPDQMLGNGREPAIWGVVRWTVHRAWPGRHPLS